MRLPSPRLASAFAKTHDAVLHGPDQHIHGANEIHRVETGDLTFVDHPKYYRSTLESPASVILMDQLPDGGIPEGKTVLLHARPFEVYDALIKEVRPPYSLRQNPAQSASVHASAIVEPGAVIGEKVVIGAHTRVEANAVVYGPCRIGERCRIGAGAVIGDLAFYFRGVNTDAVELRQRSRRRWTTGGEVVIEDDVEIGPQCNIARGVSAVTRIGRGTKIDAACMIAHGVEIGEDCLLAAHVAIAGKSRVGDRCILYGQTGVAQNVEIGADAVCLGRAGVSKSIPGGIVYNGNPAQPAREWLKGVAAVRRLARG